MFILVFIVTILILVVIHELGHFFVAKKFGIKVLEFGFGIPPRIWGKKWGETLISINWLPFGGFVRLLGEDEVVAKDKDYKRAFSAQPVWKRSLVVVAGVLMNLFLAFVLYYIVLASQGFSVQIPALADHDFVGVEESQKQAVFISQVKEDLPEAKFNINAGEKVVAVDDKPVENIEQLRAAVLESQKSEIKLTLTDIQNNEKREVTIPLGKPSVFIELISEDSPAKEVGLGVGERVLATNGEQVTSLQEFASKIKENAGKEVILTLSDAKGEKTRQVTITPRVNPPAGQGALGVVLRESLVPNLDFSEISFYQLSYPQFWQKALAGPIHAYNLTAYSMKILGQTISQAVTKKDLAPVSSSVAGPIGITNLLRQILEIKNPLIPYLDFMAAISLNLALVNILPFPGLDGGRFFFLLIEGITRRKLNENIEKYIHTVGLVILLGLIFLITVSDIRKLLPF